MRAKLFRNSALAFASGCFVFLLTPLSFAADQVCDDVPEDPPSILAPEGEPDPRLLAFAKLFSERIIGKQASPEDRERLLSLLETTPHSRTLLPFVIASLGDLPRASADFPRLARIARENPSATLLNLTMGELLFAAPGKETADEKSVRLEQAYGFLHVAFHSLTDAEAAAKTAPDKETRHAVIKYMMVCLQLEKEQELEEAIRRIRSIPVYHDDPDFSSLILLMILSRMEKVRPLTLVPLTGPLPDRAFSLQCDFAEEFPHFLKLLESGRFTGARFFGQLAGILVRKGKTGELRRALLTWILHADSNRAVPLEFLAAVEELSGRFMTAGRLMELIIASGKAENPARTIFAATNLYRDAGDPRRALTLLKKYESRIPDKAALAGYYVPLYLMLQDIPSALKTAELLPEDHAKYIQLMLMQKDLKKWQEAAESGKKALAFIKKNKLKLKQNAFYFVYSEVLEKIGDVDGVRAVLEPLIREDPEDPDLLNFLGYVLADHNRELDYAQRLIERALRKKPDSAAILDSMAWVLYRKGLFQEAETFIMRSLKQCETEPDATILDHAGDIFMALGDKEKAADFWHRALLLLKESGSDPDLEKAVRKKLPAPL